MLIPVTIDGQTIEVEKGTTVLEAARLLGIRIPTLCYHEAVSPYGACRLCQVEVESRGRRRLRTSCEYPILRAGEVVYMDTEAVLRIRRLILELLLARCPDVPILHELVPRLDWSACVWRLSANRPSAFCVGCASDVCNEVLGRNAISFAGRGVQRSISTPYGVNSEVCIGCGACASVCPTGVIRIREYDGKRHLRFWNTEVELIACASCGAQFAPGATLLAARERIGDLLEITTLLPDCRSRSTCAQLVVGLEKAGVHDLPVCPSSSEGVELCPKIGCSSSYERRKSPGYPRRRNLRTSAR